MNYNIVFQEIPNEVTLAINISNCPNRCKGCHSLYLWKDSGKELNEHTINILLEKYADSITCVCLMGGDSEPEEVEKLSLFIRSETNGKLKTGWYSGKSNLPECCNIRHFNFIKLGPYIEKLGGLKSENTNQRLFQIENGEMIDITFLMKRKRKVSPTLS